MIPSPEWEDPNATSAHEAGPGPFRWDYDDGNGLWITLEESPFDQGFSGKYYPQDYTLQRTTERSEDRGVWRRVLRRVLSFRGLL